MGSRSLSGASRVRYNMGSRSLSGASRVRHNMGSRSLLRSLPCATSRARRNIGSRSLLRRRAGGARSRPSGRRGRPSPDPAALRRELDFVGPQSRDSEAVSSGGEEGGDVYEFEKETLQEESKKNRRFETVLRSDLPHDFKRRKALAGSQDDDDELESESEVEEDGERHRRMLEGITGMPGEAFNVVLDRLVFDHPRDGFEKDSKGVE